MGRPILFALDITKKSQKVVKISPKNYLNTAKDLENNDNPTGKMLNIFISHLPPIFFGNTFFFEKVYFLLKIKTDSKNDYTFDIDIVTLKRFFSQILISY